MIKFKCSKCGVAIETHDINAGQMLKCRECFKLQMVPAVASAAAVEPEPSGRQDTVSGQAAQLRIRHKGPAVSEKKCPSCELAVSARELLCPKCGFVWVDDAPSTKDLITHRADFYSGIRFTILGTVFLVGGIGVAIGWRFLATILHMPDFAIQFFICASWALIGAGYFIYIYGAGHFATWRKYPRWLGIILGGSLIGLAVMLLLPRKEG